MARPQLRARFFITPDGVAVEKAPPLKSDERRAIFHRDGWSCAYCGVRVTLYRYQSPWLSDTKPGAVDHVFPRARGGQNDPSNLRLACERCNASKGADT
jgi:5-methylcytosine-specific restriction endonuclease McrA